MKKILLPALVIVMLASIPAMAQYYNSDDGTGIHFGVKGGWAFTQGEDLKDTIGSNWIVGADLNYFLTKNIGIGVDFRYSAKTAAEVEVNEVPTDVNWNSMPLSVNALFQTKVGRSTVYFGGGVSFVQTTYGFTFDFGEFDFSQDESAWATGVDVIAGMETNNVYLEVQFVVAEATFDNEELLILIDENGTLNVGLISVMVGYRF